MQAGLSPLRAIAPATRNAAELLNLHDRGVIAPGKRADLLIVNGDPGADIAAIDNVWETWANGHPESGIMQQHRP